MQRRTIRKHGPERGNATIYVLIVVALFAALAFAVARQNDTSEGGGLSAEKADIIAAQLMAYPYQVKQSIDMMGMTGTDMSALDFTQPGQTDFNTPPNSTKIFHPGGGGLNLARLPEDGVAENSTTPAAGWYLGMFNNLGWSRSAENDVMLVAYQIDRMVCERINLRLMGSNTIPTLSDTIPNVLIDIENPPGVTVHGGSNVPTFDTGICADCEGKPALCVGDTSGTRYGFYTMIINR